MKTIKNKLTNVIFQRISAITKDGKIMTATYSMAEYNQDHFVLEISAKEIKPPHRISTTQVTVSFYSYKFIIHSNSSFLIPLSYH